MKVLLIASRPPSPAFTGDSARTRMWLDALCEIASVTVIAPPHASDKLPCSRYVVVRRSLTSFLAAVFRIIRDRLPLHLAVPGQWDWPDAIRRAADFGPYDLAIVMLSRLDPLVSPSLGKTRAILDAIDSLTTNLRERQRAAGPVASRLWSFEAERMSRLEASIAERYWSVVTVSPDQTPPFGRESVIVPMGVSVLERPEVERDFDVAFWGRLPYFANDDALRCLVRRVWPEIRDRRPQSTLLIAGADAAGWVRRHDGANGIRVFSPMTDRPGLLRRVKVAVFPISFGSGLPMKTLEAAEASCAIVGTPMAFRGFVDLSRVAVVEPIDRIGAATVSLLEDSERRVAMGTRLRSIVIREYAVSRTYDQMRRVVERAVAG